MKAYAAKSLAAVKPGFMKVGRAKPLTNTAWE
jgi:hypothetical protein